MNNIFTFKLGGCFTGDVIYMLAGIKACCERKNFKADLYLWLDRPVKSYDGAQHPYNGSGINRYAFEMLRPLIESQSYINSVQEYAGQTVAADLDELRTKVIAPMPYGSIARWPGYAWPDMQGDVGRSWIETPTSVWEGAILNPCHNKIIINRTSRYQNSMIHYWFLRDVQDQLIFAGLPDEHEAFCKSWELDIPLLKVQDFLELAIALRSCRYFIGNQSMCFALAEAMKIPRLLEVCNYAPNVIPCGEHAYDFLHQFAVEWFVKDKESPLNKL